MRMVFWWAEAEGVRKILALAARCRTSFEKAENLLREVKKFDELRTRLSRDEAHYDIVQFCREANPGVVV